MAGVHEEGMYRSSTDYVNSKTYQFKSILIGIYINN